MAKPKLQRPDLALFAIVIVLAGFGLVMVFSASSVPGGDTIQQTFHMAQRQSIWFFLGLFTLFVFMNLDYHLFRRLAWPALLVSIVLLIVVLYAAPVVGGARRWIPLGFFNLQPSEVAKFAIINLAAAYIASRGRKIRRLFSGVLPLMGITAAIFMLIVQQPDLGTAAAMAATIVMMLFVGGGHLFHLVLMGGMALAGVGYLAYSMPYRFRRITAFIDPWSDPLDSGWNIIQSLLAVGSGGFFGVGLGQGKQKFSYLPEHHTDFIYAVIAEELGFLGAGTVLLLFGLLLWRGYSIALSARDTYGTMLAIGLTTMLGFQALLNMGVATGSVPVTGIPLPFISYGGSAMLTAMAAAGTVLNISRQRRSVARTARDET